MFVHVFEAVGYEGDVTESEEMAPSWFAAQEDSLPFDSMWPGT
jgi:hypothetical protein